MKPVNAACHAILTQTPNIPNPGRVFKVSLPIYTVGHLPLFVATARMTAFQNNAAGRQQSQ